MLLLPQFIGQKLPRLPLASWSVRVCSWWPNIYTVVISRGWGEFQPLSLRCGRLSWAIVDCLRECLKLHRAILRLSGLEGGREVGHALSQATLFTRTAKAVLKHCELPCRLVLPCNLSELGELLCTGKGGSLGVDRLTIEYHIRILLTTISWGTIPLTIPSLGSR